MVCDGAMIASTIVSLMTNGVCCLWQHQEEVDRRETIRRDIRAEYWQQRLIDHEFVMSQYYREEQLEQQQDRCRPQEQYPYLTVTATGGGPTSRARLYSGSSASSTTGFLVEEPSADERRRQLLLNKRKASTQMMPVQHEEEHIGGAAANKSGAEIQRRDQPTVCTDPLQRRAPPLTTDASHHCRMLSIEPVQPESLPPTIAVNPRRHSASPRVGTDAYRWREGSSPLMTLEDMGRTSSRTCSLADEEDDDDDDENFIEIPLR